MPTGEELKNKGVEQFMQGDYEDAAETFKQAIAAYEDEGAGDMVAEMQVNLGLSLHSMGESEQALEQMNMAHAVFAQINDQSRTAQCLGNMARVYAKLGNTEQALTNYREASALFMQLGDEENYGQTVLAIADLQMRSGQLMKAAATFEVGLDYIKNPTGRQKMMKKLLGVRNKLTGQGVAKGEGGDEDADEGDDE
ncbi:MAG: tetratricopeptide repeat protein [Anaerolineae bacterium]|nr:tetratricopeptide repeat protein [Anaerolineae bacterium]